MKAFFVAVLLACLLPSTWSATTCSPAGAFAAAGGSCCQGLVLDGARRCQYATCKKLNMQSVINANGMSDCCFGLAPVSGTCRVPMLSRTACAILGDAPTTTRPCCKGLAKGSNGTCSRNSVAVCNSAQVATSCYGTSVNTSTCYCPSPYYAGT